MRHFLPAIGACLTFAACGAVGANPDDLALNLKLTRGPAVFHAGEPVEFALSYSTTTAGKYRGTWTNPSPMLDTVTLRLSPASERRESHEMSHGVAVSILSGIGGLEPGCPVPQQADLADWYRFDKGGHFSLSVASSQVSRIKRLEEGGGLEPVPLESNTVEFDVLPPDPAWEEHELAAIMDDLEGSGEQQAHVLHLLELMDTAGSLQKLLMLFLAGAAPTGDQPRQESTYEVYRGLTTSRHTDLIVPALEAALDDPRRRPSSTLIDLLVGMQVFQEFRPMKPVPDDPEAKKEWDAGWEKRNKALGRYQARAIDKLLAGIRQRTGAARNAALFDAWQLAELRKAGVEETPAVLVQLRQEMLAAARDLPVPDALSFVMQVWQYLPHEQVLPVVRYLALSIGRVPKEQAAIVQLDAYPLWCEEAAAECHEAILAEAVKPDSVMLPVTILRLSETEHSELDATLAEMLTAATRQNNQVDSATEALILRAGSHNLVTTVKDALKRAQSCEAQGYLAGYLFRFDAEAAAQYVRKAASEKTNPCRLFDALNDAGHTDAVIPVAVDALDRPNLAVAGGAALFLSAWP